MNQHPYSTTSHAHGNSTQWLFDPNPADERIAFTYHGYDVTYDDDRLINLTDVWKAAGSSSEQKPNDWSQTPEAQRFITDLAKSLNTGKSGIWKTRRGKHGGGTWAHWQIALAYAKYLSPEFHRFVNEAFREWAEEKADPDLKARRAVDGYRQRGKDDAWISARLEGIVRRHGLTDTLKEHGVHGRGYALCTDAINEEVLGSSAKEIKIARGLPARARTRDHLEDYELDGVKLAESMARRKVKDECAHGNGPCCCVCRRAGQVVKQAIAAMGLSSDRSPAGIEDRR